MERRMFVRMAAQPLQNTQQDDIETLHILILFNHNQLNSRLTLQKFHGSWQEFRLNLRNNDEQRRQRIRSFLSVMKIPFNGDQELSQFVDNIFQYLKLIPQPYIDERGNMVSTEIIVQVHLQRWPQSLEVNYDEAAAMAQSMEIGVFGSELVAKVKVRGSDESCAICLENFPVGLESEVTRLPCMHLFHGKCIVKWRSRSHTCPLCRFPI